MNTIERSNGKWRKILTKLGVEESYLNGKQGPCPFCKAGTDRFVFDDKDGMGTYICRHCGAGTGMDFLKRFKGWDFRTAAFEVDRVEGHIKPDKQKPKLTSQQQRDMLNRLWRAAERLSGSDAVSAYLKSRNALCGAENLKYHPFCPKPNAGGEGPAMLARVVDPFGVPVNIHRTFLTMDAGKRIKATMPGDLPDGSCVRLFPVSGKKMGIAEGIETACCASQRFSLPVWSALNATMLAKWIPPEGVEEIHIFGDNDDSFTGHAASYALAKRLASKKKWLVEVHIPERVNTDWADD